MSGTKGMRVWKDGGRERRIDAWMDGLIWQVSIDLQIYFFISLYYLCQATNSDNSAQNEANIGEGETSDL